MTRFFCADPHIGHTRIAELRGYSTTQEHDNAVLQPIRELKRGDQLWVLGDLSSGGRKAEDRALEQLADAIPEGVGAHLIAGNHDSCSPVHRESYKRQKVFLEVFDSVQPFARMKLEGRYFMLSHFDYMGMRWLHRDANVERENEYDQYRLHDHGKWLIHGHTHQPVPYRRFVHPRSICVSWESWKRLVSERDILHIVADAEWREGCYTVDCTVPIGS